MLNPKLIHKRLQKVKDSPDGCPPWLEEGVNKLLATPSGAAQFELAAEITSRLYSEVDSSPITKLNFKTANAYEALMKAVNPWGNYWKMRQKIDRNKSPPQLTVEESNRGRWGSGEQGSGPFKDAAPTE